MAVYPPPANYRVPIVYGAARNPSWIKRGQVKKLAFYRRKNRDHSGLTVGDSIQAAERGLDEHFGIIQIAVADILSVRLQNDIPPIRLQVAPKEAVPDQGNINTTLPFYDDPDLAQVGIAIKIAEVLADMARPHHEEEALAE
jgi:hypothetical protein